MVKITYPGYQGGEAPLDPPPMAEMLRLVSDFQHARRQRRHYLVDHQDQVVFGAKTLAECFAFLTHHDIWAVLWQNGADARILTLTPPGSPLARLIREVWAEVELRKASTNGKDNSTPAEL